MPPGWTYSPKEGQSDNPNLSERATELVAALRARMAPERPYADIIQEIELPNIESALLLLGRQYCWFSDTLALREVWLGLQERINKYALADNTANKHLMRPRLQHAIAWLQAYEDQLATYLASNQADELSASTLQALPAATQSTPSSAKDDTDILIGVLTEQRTTRPTIPATVGVLLQSGTGQIKEFTPDHAERLLDYPSSLWMKAPDGALPTPLPPAEPNKKLCYCQTHPNTRTLNELPADCHIHETIRKHLPEIEEQIAARKLADTSAGFRAYCEGELARHVKNVGDLTKNLAHPTIYSEQERPQMLELKFWNLALCTIYKQELEPSTLQYSSQQNSHNFTDAANTAAADVRQYFPAVATIHGSTATHVNALQQLAVWLLHWAEQHGHRPTSDEYSLAGRLREQQAAHSHAGKFLKACRRLHNALQQLAADEQDVKQLLGSEHNPHSRANLAAVLKWWAGWIKEQQLAHDDPAGAYLAALRRVPVEEEWENGSPRYTLPTYLGIYDEFEAEISPLRQAFEAALPDLPTKKKRAIHHGLTELMGIDRTGVQRRREQFERGEYGLDFLPSDYPALRFNVAGQSGAFKWQWVGPLFWSGLGALLQYKQAAARAACEQLTAALPEVAHRVEAPAGSPAIPLLTPAVIRTLYLKLLEHSSLVGELTAYQKSELRTYAESEQLSVTRLAVELMDNNPNYVYPSEYLNGREAEYWMEKSVNYWDSLRVLQLLNPPTASVAHNNLVPLAVVPPHAFVSLLLNYTVPQLRELLEELGLVTSNGRAAPAASPGAWVGVIHALLEAQPPRLRGSKAAIRRAFCEALGANVSERAVQAGLGTNGSEAEQFRDRALAVLGRAR